MTSLTAIVIFVVSMLLSAFFSGSETGLYRIPRLRLVIDSLSGKTWSRVLLWLTNNPSFSFHPSSLARWSSFMESCFQRICSCRRPIV